MRPRLLATLFAAALALSPAVSRGQTETFPSHPVRMIIAFSAGGSVDALGRIVAQKLSEQWGQQVTVENRTGALGNIGALAAARSPADGYTLHFATQSLAVNVTLAPMAELDPLRDFEPIMLVASAQDILIVPPDSPFKTVKEVIDFAKANPRQLTYGTLGTSSSGNMAVAVFAEMNGRLEMRQVPYSQTSQLTTDVMSGRVDVFFPTTGAHVGNVVSGRVRALGVSGSKRAEQLPDIPTFKESGVTYPDATSWYGLFAPKGTPRDIVAKINRDLAHILALPEVRELQSKLGFVTIGGSPEKLGEYFKSEITKWGEIARDPLFIGK